MRKLLLPTLLVCCAALCACRPDDGIPCPFGPDDLGASPVSVTFRFENQACTTVCQVFLGSPSCDDWGITLLGEDSLPHGLSIDFQIPPGTYDLLIVECSEATYQMTDLDLSEDGTWTFGLEEAIPGTACPAALTVVNQSPTDICHMWIAGPQSERYGYNWLGDDVIPAGQALTFPVSPGTYDVMAQDCDFNTLRVELDKDILAPVIWNVP